VYLNENISGIQSSEVLYSINSFFSFLSRKIWIILYCFALWNSLVWLLWWCHLCHSEYIYAVFFIYNSLIQIFMMKPLGVQFCKKALRLSPGNNIYISLTWLLRIILILSGCNCSTVALCFTGPVMGQSSAKTEKSTLCKFKDEAFSELKL